MNYLEISYATIDIINKCKKISVKHLRLINTGSYIFEAFVLEDIETLQIEQLDVQEIEFNNKNIPFTNLKYLRLGAFDEESLTDNLLNFTNGLNDIK